MQLRIHPIPLSLVLALLASSVVTAEEGTLKVSADFPNGSVTVESIDQEQRTLFVIPAHHKDRGWECWWYFKVEGIRPGETLTINVGNGVWATPDRAMFSLDNKTWQHTAPGMRAKERILYKQQVDADTAWFAWGPPFVPEDAYELVKKLAESSPHATMFELCKTRENRSVPALRVDETNENSPKFGLWIQARQHAWESGSSWVGKGFAEWLLSDDPRAQSLRKQAVIVYVPIMDLDNVTIGAGGKNQVPHDHNRDWSDQPVFRSVEAAQTGILDMNSKGQFDLFIDLHNPSASDREPYFYVSPPDLLKPAANANLKQFLGAAKKEMTGPLTFKGKTIASGKSYDPKAWDKISKNWVSAHCADHVVAATLETAWNTPNSTPAGYQQLGVELGKAIELYLRSNPRETKGEP